jgi:two-component system chemotaxis sensor kinase CheA
MHEIFDVKSVKSTNLTEGLIVVVDGQGIRCGLFIDDLLGQQQVVIKSLEANYRKVEGVSGATILGDGSVALILDIPGLVRLSNQ